MELGEKIRQARLEAGLSQRQLSGEEITRNMLSLIEHGSARPSMKTLQYLAQRLGKPLSWFLDEDAEIVDTAAQAVALLAKAEQAILDGRDIYASELLNQITGASPEILRKKLLLFSRLPGARPEELCRNLPSLDEELLLRATAALVCENPDRCRKLLDAVEDQTSPRWNLLSGQLRQQMRDYEQAISCLQKAEDAFPEESAAGLEVCFREQGNFERAYYYACKRRT